MGGKTAAARPEIAEQRAALLAQFYTSQDICALLHDPPVSMKTFQRMIEKGEFSVPKLVLPGPAVVYKKDEFHEWFQNEFLAGRTVRPVRRRRYGWGS